MELAKKRKLAEAVSNVQQKKELESQTLRESQQETLSKFLSDLSDLLNSGIDIHGLENVDNLVSRVGQYGQQVADLITDIRSYTASFDSLAELAIPNEVTLTTIADQNLIDALTKVGDNGELLQKIQTLDQAILLLSDSLTKAEPQGQTEQDYIPVRIVLGRKGALKFLESWPIPAFMGGGASSSSTSGTVWGLNDKEDTGTYIYYGFEDASNTWKIIRKTSATSTFRYAYGASGYSAAWTARASQSYATYGSTF